MVDDTAKKMHRKSYRFYWFARKSWSFTQGHRLTYFTGFWKAWHRFNALVLHDIKCEGCCGCDE